MKNAFLSLFAVVALASSVTASTISVNNGGTPGNQFLLNHAVMSTASVYVGYIKGFNANDATLMGKLTGGNLSEVLSVFVPLGVPYSNDGGPSTTVGTSTLTYNTSTGALTGGVAGVSPVGDAGGANANTYQSTGVAVGTRLFVLAVDSATLSANATNFALVSADPTISTAWTMPSSNLTNRALVLTAIDNTAGAGAAKEYFYGTSGSIELGPNIPEPSIVSLLSLVGIGVIRRRRK